MTTKVRMGRYVIQCRCKCGHNPRWTQAMTTEGKKEVPLVFSNKRDAEKIARDLAQVWEPDEFRVVLVKDAGRVSDGRK